MITKYKGFHNLIEKGYYYTENFDIYCSITNAISAAVETIIMCWGGTFFLYKLANDPENIIWVFFLDVVLISAIAFRYIFPKWRMKRFDISRNKKVKEKPNE
jgi:hypothetical protein